MIAKSKEKTDKADASALARFLKLDHLPEVSVPSEKVRQLRHLLQARETLVGMRTKSKNLGHAALTRNGIALPRSAFASAIARERLRKRNDLSAADWIILESALRQIAELDQEVEKLEAEIIRLGKTLKGIKRVLQLHGMNLLSAISLLAEIGLIELFETSKQLVAYSGLATSVRQSNETTRQGHITKQARRAASHGGDQSGTFDGQSNKHTTDEFLPKEETRERFRQSDLCDGAETIDDCFCDVEKGIGLLVSGRSLI